MLVPLAFSIATLFSTDEPAGERIPVARTGVVRTVVDEAAEVALEVKEEAVQLSAAAIQAPVELTNVILGPVRDSYQLVPGMQEPVLPPMAPSKDDPLGSTALMMRDVTVAANPLWKYRVEGGGNFRYGTVDTTNVNAVLAAERRSGFSIFGSKFGATYNRVDDATANRRFFGDSKYDHFVSGRWLVYGKEELENDEARRIDSRSVSSAGLGYRLLDDDCARWIARTGPTITFLNQNNPTGQDVSTIQSGWMFESELRKVFWDHCRFDWNCSVFPNFASRQTIRVRNEVGVLFPIASRKSCWNWKIGLRDEYTERPGAAVRPHDTEMYFAIVYSSG